MADKSEYSIPGFDEAVQDVADYFDSGGDREPQQREEITIKFGKGLVGEPFMSKAGKELVEISIPNSDPSDKRPWQTFVLPARDVHENKFGKGMWAKIPADGHTTVSRSVRKGEVDGKNVWGEEKKVVTNAELKTMVEFYKARNREGRESVRNRIRDASDEASDPSHHPAGKTNDKNQKEQPTI